MARIIKDAKAEMLAWLTGITERVEAGGVLDFSASGLPSWTDKGDPVTDFELRLRVPRKGKRAVKRGDLTVFPDGVVVRAMPPRKRAT
jgi:hypothetical protein